MLVLLFNAGSSSLKCTLMDSDRGEVVATGLADWAGTETRYKYAGPGAAVTVVTAVEASEVCVRVLDDGPGVDADESERLFDLYFRSKGTHAMPGSGIGLFVCRQLISGMGGRTWAVSRPEGGAEFGFTLPIYRDAETEAAVDPSPPPARRHAAAMAES